MRLLAALIIPLSLLVGCSSAPPEGPDKDSGVTTPKLEVPSKVKNRGGDHP